jgi:hypothetical protein
MTKARDEARFAAQVELDEQDVVRSRSDVDSSATKALVFGLLGVVVCCFPLSIAGILYGLQSKRLAERGGVPLPVTAAIGIGLSVFGLLALLGFAVWFGHDMMEVNERIDALKAKVAQTDAAPELAQTTACDLAELRILEDGYGGKDAIVIDGFECPGTVVYGRSDRAELTAISFHASSQRITVKVCFEKGARWSVASLRQTTACGDPPEPEPQLP